MQPADGFGMNSGVFRLPNLSYTNAGNISSIKQQSPQTCFSSKIPHKRVLDFKLKD